MAEIASGNLPVKAIERLEDCKRDALHAVREFVSDPVRIENSDHEQYFGHVLSELIARQKAAEDVLESIRKPAYEAYQAVLAFKKQILGPLETAQRQIRSALSAYHKQKVAEEEAQREALLAQIEAEAAAAKEREAALLESEGDTAAAEAVRKAPVALSAEQYEVVSGTLGVEDSLAEPSVKYRDNWSAEVVDLKALANAVASGRAPLDCIVPNQTKLNQLARGMKDTLMIPGVVAHNNPVAVAYRRQDTENWDS